MILRTYGAIYDNGVLVWENEERPVEKRARVMITILELLDGSDGDEVDDWRHLSLMGLARAYDGDNEPEYTVDDIRFT